MAVVYKAKSYKVKTKKGIQKLSLSNKRGKKSDIKGLDNLYIILEFKNFLFLLTILIIYRLQIIGELINGYRRGYL